MINIRNIIALRSLMWECYYVEVNYFRRMMIVNMIVELNKSYCLANYA